MKTLEQLKTYPGGINCNFLDHRDKQRLLDFFAPEDWIIFGFAPKEGFDPSTHTVIPYTREAVLQKLASDFAFAYQKAYNRRGISASLMGDVIKMWMWVLDDEELMNPPEWSDYGISYLKQVAEKYTLPIIDLNS